MSSGNEILHRCLFSWDALSENKLNLDKASVKGSTTQWNDCEFGYDCLQKP